MSHRREEKNHQKEISYTKHLHKVVRDLEREIKNYKIRISELETIVEALKWKLI